jgi:hypothetical protein
VRVVVGEAQQVGVSLTELPWQQRKRNGEKPVGPPPGPRCSAPRTEPPLAMGAKLARFAKSATAPCTAASELKAKRKLPPPGGRAMPAVTPRSTEAMSSPSLR